VNLLDGMPQIEPIPFNTERFSESAKREKQLLTVFMVATGYDGWDTCCALQ
jgi:hypothetical protein